jgi:hypothetical protein
MSTLAEVQEAIVHLPENERQALSIWLRSQEPARLSDADEQVLLRSLDEAMQAIDEGRGVGVEDVRARVASWASK